MSNSCIKQKCSEPNPNCNNNPQVAIVQFMHPGVEPKLNKTQIQNGNNICDWNCSNQHKRKFMQTPGKYLDINGCLTSGDVYFWGEWEPWSKVNPIMGTNPIGDFPHFIHEPVYYTHNIPCNLPNVKNLNRQNSDPFVFGDNFLYSLCQQNRQTNHPTKMMNLAPGSIILFGSRKTDQESNHYFALDTVFVVSERRQYNTNTYAKDLAGYVPANYNDIMGFQNSTEYVAYKGCSYNAQQINEMYSFVPCNKQGASTNGFERVKLTQKDLNITINNQIILSDGLSQGFKFTPSSIQENINIWNKIRTILKQNGYLEGVRMDYTMIP